jgi:hypothetical protein
MKRHRFIDFIACMWDSELVTSSVSQQNFGSPSNFNQFRRQHNVPELVCPQISIPNIRSFNFPFGKLI